MVISCVTRNESELVLAILVAVLKRVEMTNNSYQTDVACINHTHAFFHSFYLYDY